MCLCLKNGLTTLTLCTHLLGHDLLDFLRRLDVLDLHAGHLDAPLIGCFIQNGLHLAVDGLTAGQRLVELHVTDDIAEGRCRKILKTRNRILYAVGIKTRIEHFHENNGVDLHGDVILRDYRLRREIQHLLLQADGLRHALQKRHLHMEAGLPRGLVASKVFNDKHIALRDNANIYTDQNDSDDNQNNKKYGHNVLLLPQSAAGPAWNSPCKNIPL